MESIGREVIVVESNRQQCGFTQEAKTASGFCSDPAMSPERKASRRTPNAHKRRRTSHAIAQIARVYEALCFAARGERSKVTYTEEKERRDGFDVEGFRDVRQRLCFDLVLSVQFV